MKKTAHQKLSIEDHLIDNLVLQHRDLASSQNELAKGSAAKIEFLKSFYHSNFQSLTIPELMRGEVQSHADN